MNVSERLSHARTLLPENNSAKHEQLSRCCFPHLLSSVNLCEQKIATPAFGFEGFRIAPMGLAHLESRRCMLIAPFAYLRIGTEGAGRWVDYEEWAMSKGKVKALAIAKAGTVKMQRDPDLPLSDTTVRL